MKIHEMPTDETMRSLLVHGCADFPFEYYLDELGTFQSRSIEWHWHKEVEFSLVLEGSVRCFDELNVYELAPGDGLFINSETLHRFESEDGGRMINLIFSPELIAQRGSLLYREFVEGILTSECPLICFKNSEEKDKAVLQRISALYESTGRSFLAVRNAASLLWEELLNVSMDEFGQKQS